MQETQENQDYMTNAEGHLVPLTMVKEEDKLEDDVVNTLYSAAVHLNNDLRTFKQVGFDEVDAFLELLSEKYKAKKGGKKGNVQITSYDGLRRIQVSVNDFIQFGPQLQVAKDLIDECIKEWGEGGSDKITALVNHAFRVDKGQVNTQAILGLRRLNIQDDKWSAAMQAITDSIRVSNSKRYIRFYNRPSPEAQWVAVPLDLARV